RQSAPRLERPCRDAFVPLRIDARDARGHRRDGDIGALTRDARLQTSDRLQPPRLPAFEKIGECRQQRLTQGDRNEYLPSLGVVRTVELVWCHANDGERAAVDDDRAP